MTDSAVIPAHDCTDLDCAITAKAHRLLNSISCHDGFACTLGRHDISWAYAKRLAASANNIHPNQVSTWKKQLLVEGPTVFGQQIAKKLQEQTAREAELFEQIGRLKMELEWLKKKATPFE